MTMIMPVPIPGITKEPRPTIIGGLTVKVQTGCGNMYCQLNWCHGRLFEVFATLGKSGGCASCHTEATTRSVTAMLRCGISIDECIDNLRGLRCQNPVMFPKDHEVLSCPDGIAKTMIKYGQLSVVQVAALLLIANDIAIESVMLPDIVSTIDMSSVVSNGKDNEREQAMAVIEDLRKRREEDGLYE